jgi:hypothetical protein
MMDKSENPKILSVIHHRQNPLESTHLPMFNIFTVIEVT